MSSSEDEPRPRKARSKLSPPASPDSRAQSAPAVPSPVKLVRAKPRARAKAASLAIPALGARAKTEDPASVAGPSSSQIEPQEDFNSLFIRRKVLNFKSKGGVVVSQKIIDANKKLGEADGSLTIDLDAISDISDAEQNSSSDDEGPKKKKAKAGKGKGKAKQELKSSPVKKPLVIDDDSSLDSDASDSKARRIRHAKEAEERKVKAKRKARSITPPEKPDEYELSQAVYARRANDMRYDVSNIHRFESTEIDHSIVFDTTDHSIMNLDPELAKIARQARSEDRSPAPRAESEGIPVDMTVVMIFDPRRLQESVSQRAVKVFTTPIQLEMSSKSNFEAFFGKVSVERGIPRDQLIFTYEDKRVYTYSTPHSLGIFSSGKMKGYQSEVYQYIQNQRYKARTEPLPEPKDDEEDGFDSAPAAATEKSQTGIRITVRDSQQRTLDLMVPKTSKITSIIKQYLKFASIPVEDIAKYRLEFDGESIDPTSRLEEVDVEDEDMLEVKGP